MLVLFDLTFLGTRSRMRGIGRYVADLATGLAELDDPDLKVLGLERAGVVRSPSASDLKGAVPRLLTGEARSHYHWAYALRVGLGRAVSRFSADIVHTPHPNATPIGRMHARRITTCHDLIPLTYPEHYVDFKDGGARGRKWLDGRRYRSADHVIAVSSATASDLVRMLDIPASKITVVHNGVDLSRWREGVPEHESEVLRTAGLAGKRYLLVVGPPEWRKNPEGTIAAFAHARRENPEDDLQLAWASGLSPEQQKHIESLAEQHGVAGAVRCLGFVPDGLLRALYRHALALLFVSRSEGFGYPMIEAMAAGCPVITSNCSSMAELAKDAALLVDPENAAAIAEAITALVRSESERQRLIGAGTLRAESLSLQHMARGTADVYRAVRA